MASFRKPVLLFNPLAGKLRTDPKRLERAVARLETQGIAPRLVPTRGPGTAAGQAKECIDAGADLVLVAGGDGTVNEVLGGVAGTGVPLGVLPGGTANVLCCEMRAGTNMEKVAARFGDYVPADVSLGMFRPDGRAVRYFLLMAGVGLDARIVRQVGPEWKARLGKLSYWAGGFGQVFHRLAPIDAEFNGRVHRCGFALASRVRNYGGDLEIATHADLFDDAFAVIAFRGSLAFTYLYYFAGVLLHQQQRLPGVVVGRTTHLRLTPASGREVFVQVDGEDAGPLPATLEIVPSALRLMVPSAYAAASNAIAAQRAVLIPSNSV